MRRHLASLLVGTLASAAALTCTDAPTRPTVLPFDPALVVVPTDSALHSLATRAASEAARDAHVPSAARLEVVSVTDLGALGVGGSYASGINDAGQVVGTNDVNDDGGFAGQHAFLWERATGMRDLGTFGADFSRATAINDAGRVVGFVATFVSREDLYEGQEWPLARAFVWDAASGMRELGTIGGAFEASVATDVNAAGQVVGYSETLCGCHGFGWDESRATMWAPEAAPLNLGLLPGLWSQVSRAEGINDAGHVVGPSYSYEEDLDEPSQAFRWSPAQGMEPLAPLPGRGAAAVDVNDARQVVGASGGHTYVGLYSIESVVDGGNATIWEADGAAVDLGRLPGDASSVATAINSAGHVVGSSSGQQTRPFLWERGVGMRALPLLSGHVDGHASDLNDAGQVVGWSGQRSQGLSGRRAVLWTLRAPGAPVADRLQAGALAPGV